LEKFPAAPLIYIKAAPLKTTLAPLLKNPCEDNRWQQRKEHKKKYFFDLSIMQNLIL
jgi:hypothetical protein